MTAENQAPGTEVAVYDVPDHEEPAADQMRPTGKTSSEYRVQAIAEALQPAYQNASKLVLTQEEAEQLAQDFPDEAFRLGAGGNMDLLYIEHAYLRERLNSVLGVGSSVPIKRGHWVEEFKYPKRIYRNGQDTGRVEWKTGYRVYAEILLVVRGCLVGEAVGDSCYYPDNSATNFGDALEGAKSNAMRRCCKEFGIGLQVWKKGFVETWKAKYAKEEPRGQRGQQRPQGQPTQQTTAKPAQQQTEPAKPAAPAVPPIPKHWPNTSLADLLVYISELDRPAFFNYANELMFGPDSPFAEINERAQLVDALHAAYHDKLALVPEERKAACAEVTRRIDETKAETDIARQALLESEGEAPPDSFA